MTVNSVLPKSIFMRKLKGVIPLKCTLENFSTVASTISAKLTPLAELVLVHPGVLRVEEGEGRMCWSATSEFPP